VNGADGQYEYYVTGATTADRIGIAPGTFALGVGNTPNGPPQRFTSADECVAANLKDPPFVFDFAGGKLGIYNSDFQPGDNAAGPNVGAPTFALIACR
jgi:hypothetical protein